MDGYEATRIVFSRIQNLDPENASKIMGYLLIQDHGDKEMIRLAFGPETLLHSLILKARKDLGLGLGLSNANPTTTSAPNPISISRQNSSPSWGFSDFHIDEFQLQQHLSFLNEGKPPSDLLYPEGVSSNGGQHRRSMSVTTDICLGGGGGGSDSLASSAFGWKPCLYYARGYCKNGTSCRFLHDSSDPTTPFPQLIGSPTSLELMQHQQQQHQRLSTSPQLLSSTPFPYSPSHRAGAAGLMLGEDVHQFALGRSRIDRNDNPGARQIYLTFPADSTFREEDVSNYFSIYGPVQDVRIPYQQKRMFGFVTFVYPETVKLILAKGNPHFVCDARVLVKPYKEKGKVPDKKQQQAERGEFSAPTTPNGHDSYDMLLSMQMQSSPRLMFNNHDLILRRKLEEQAELQQAIELQSRRLMGLHLLDVNKHQFHRRNLSAGTMPIPSITHSQTLLNQGFVIPMPLPDQTSPAALDVAENCATPAISLATVTDQRLTQQSELNGCESGKEEISNPADSNFHDSVEHNLPDSPFASPTKSGGDPSSLVFTTGGEAQQSISVTFAPSSSLSLSSSTNNNSLDASSSVPTSSSVDAASFKPGFLQLPRFPSGHGAVQM